VSVSTAPGARIRRSAKTAVGAWNRIGEQTQFYAKTVAGTPDAVIHYKAELLRLFTQMSLGIGALALIGGSIVIVGFLGANVGALVALQVYGNLSNIGVEALSGFASAYINTRLAVPAIGGIALAATIGASTTAQLGSQRISEEIDALESISVKTISYLCSTRLIAGVAVAIPLYCGALLCGWLATRVGTLVLYGQSAGVYDHYFSTFLNPMDVVFSFLQAIVMAAAIMLICTYYGYNAAGGPAGVGEAVGRAVRASLVTVFFVILVVAMATYGQAGLNLSG
jgi:phospholipid/cholesterol/gamma-HCH transport system permease protein